jgi:hypothetical protein
MFLRKGLFLCRSLENEADMPRHLAERLHEINHGRSSVATDKIPTAASHCDTPSKSSLLSARES